MKIVHIIQLYHPSIGGSQTHVTSLSEELAKLGEEVIVYTANAVDLMDVLRPPAENLVLPLIEKRNGVTVKRFRVNYGLKKFMFHHVLKIRGGYRFLKFIFGDFLEYWRHGPLTLGMVSQLLKDKPDLVMVSNDYTFQCVIGYWARKWLRIPFVFIPITHSFHPWTNHPSLKKVLEKADSIIACTAFEKNFLISQGIDRDKISAIPLGIDYRQWMRLPKTLNVREQYGLGRDPVVGYLGRKSEGKGVEFLIQAMRIVWRTVPSAKLLLPGKLEESFKKTMEAELNQLTQEELARVLIINDLLDQDKKSFYAAMDIMVMVSHMDSFGLVYLEAWATELPVIAAKGTPQESFIEDGIDGLLVQYGDASAMATAILKLLNDQCLRQEMGDRGNFKVESKYNIEFYAQDVRRVYKRVVSAQ